MKPALILVFAAVMPFASIADTPVAAVAAPVDSVMEVSGQTETAPEWGPVDAAGLTLEEFLWLRRPIVVFANTPNDPLFMQQMRNLEAEPDALIERDVVVIFDTDPAARGAVRTQLRPRGFSMVLLDKDGKVMLRKPSPWSVREITHAIDKFPLRRQEMLQERPAGR